MMVMAKSTNVQLQGVAQTKTAKKPMKNLSVPIRQVKRSTVRMTVQETTQPTKMREKTLLAT